VFLDAHENGTENEQYAALLALRLFGYEAWGVGYDDELVYEVKEPGSDAGRIVRPRVTPTSPG